MVLVKVVPVMRKHDVRRDLLLQPLKITFYVHADVGEETGGECLYDNTLRFRLLEKDLRTLARFFRPPLVRTEDDPIDARSLVLLEQFQDRSSASDFDVVTMGTQAEDPDVLIAPLLENQVKHGSTPAHSSAQSSKPPREPRPAHTYRPMSVCL